MVKKQIKGNLIDIFAEATVRWHFRQLCPSCVVKSLPLIHVPAPAQTRTQSSFQSEPVIRECLAQI
jgi:hypothetical protein